MAIKPVLIYRNSDSTADLNSRFARIVDRGIFDGGHLSPSSTSLTMGIAPFVAAGYDGIVAISDSNETRTVPAPAAAGPSRVSYLILHLEYRSLTSSIANLQVVPETTFLTSISKEYFVAFARIEVPFGATSLQDPGVVIDYSIGDWAEKAGKSGWRSPVADFASLPSISASGPNLGNRDGDVRIVLDTLTPYAWDSSSETWNAVGGATDLASAVEVSQQSSSIQSRALNGSGIIGSTNNDSFLQGGYGFAGGFSHRGPDSSLPIVVQSTTADRIDLGPLHSIVNGHLVKTPYTEVSLSAPTAGRYDVVYLEVWREVIPGSVSSESFPNDPTVGGTSTYSQLRANLEQLLEQFTSPNIGFGSIEAYDSSFVATRWQIGVQSGVSSNSLNNILLAAPSVTNIDGNPFGTSASQNDQRLWSASSVTSVDGVSWAIPLILIRRTLSETGPSSYVLSTRSDDNNDRYVFDVAPRAELGAGIQEMSTVGGEQSSLSTSISSSKGPSGFYKSTFSPLVPSAGGITLSPCVVRVKGSDLRTENPIPVVLPSAPATGSRRDLVVVEVEKTIHPHGNPQFRGPSELIRYNRMGLRSAQWLGRVRTFSVGSAMDTSDAMTAAGYTLSSEDPGLWERATLPHEDAGGEDPSLTGVVYAIPVSLVHRRNTQTWAASPPSFQNGSSGRPDGITSSSNPAQKEVLDIRHTLTSKEEASSILEESRDLLYRGDLRTRMRESSLSSDVAGTQYLQVDRVASAPAAGTFTIPGAPNGSVTFWGDSDEAVLLSATFPVWNSGGAVTDGSSTPTFTWSGTPTEGFLTINAPPGYVLNLDNDRTSTLLGPGGVQVITHTVGTNTATDVPYAASFSPGSISFDAEGNLASAASGGIAIPLPAGASSAGVVHVQVWARRPSRGRGPTYSNNGGMFEVADNVHRIDFFNGVSTVEVDSSPLVAQVTASPVGDQITITQADLFAALGGAGNKYASVASQLRMYGILDVSIQGSSLALPSGSPKITYVDLQNAAGLAQGFEQIVVSFDPGSVATPVTFTVAFDGDLINRWAIVSPFNRGVRGLYSWSTSAIRPTFVGGSSGASQVQPTRNPTALPSRNFLVPVRDSGYSGFFLGTSNGSEVSSLSWGGSELMAYARNVTTSSPQWRLWTDPGLRDNTNIGGVNTITVGVKDALSDPLYTSGYSAFASFDYSVSPGFDFEVLLVSPCRVPLTAAQSLTVYYDMTPYQGLADAYPLQDKTTGTVIKVGDVDVHTMGTNMPWISPRSLSWDFRGEVVLAQDTGSPASRGQDLLQLRNSHGSAVLESSSTHDAGTRSIGALTRRLPTGGSVYGVSEAETLVENTLLFDRPATVSRVIHPEEARGDDVGALVGMEYSLGAWRAPSVADRYAYYPLIVPDGAYINGITVRVGTATSASFELDLLNINPPSSSTIATATISTSSSDEEVRVYEFDGVGALKQSSNNYVLRVRSLTPGAEHFVYTVTVYYRDPSVPSSNSSRRKYSRLVRTEYEGQGAGSLLHTGAVLSNPWSAPDFATLESSFFANGDSSYGSVPRGKVSRYSLDLGVASASSSLGSFLYYVPLSDLEAQDSLSVLDRLGVYISWPFADSPRSRTLPSSFASSTQEVYGAHSPDTTSSSLSDSLFVGASFTYLIKDPSGLISLVVSHSILNSSSADRSSILRVRTGREAAIDAFYPVGRPLYTKDS